MNVLGIDPSWAKPIAWAFVKHETVFHVGNFPSGKEINISHMGSLAKDHDISFMDIKKVVIEESRPGNIYAAKLMDRTGGILRTLIYQYGLSREHIFFVNPSTWQASYKLLGRKREAIHKSSIIIAKHYWPKLTEKDDDIASAILIALWGARNLR